MKTFCLVSLACVAVFGAITRKPTTIGDNFEYWCSGHCSDDVNTSPHPGLILMGGGTDVDEAFKQHIDWSDCGDFLVIRSDRDKDYDEYVYDLSCANSAATLYIKNSDGANDATVIDYINKAEAIFFAGGNQATYLHDWKGSKLQTAVQSAIDDRNVPIGGTSAGCDIQSYFIYTASNGSVKSSEALTNPYNEYMTFSDHFLIQPHNNILNNTIIDTHFVTRDRFGRLMTFVARMRKDKKRPVFGIGINEQSAFAIDLHTGMGQLLGPQKSSEAYVIMPTTDPDVCERNRPLTYYDVPVQKLKAEYYDTFDFVRWTGGESEHHYEFSYVKGIPQGSPY